MRKKWTKEEEDFLRTNFTSLSRKELAKKLGKTEAQIKFKLKRLGLRLTEEELKKRKGHTKSDMAIGDCFGGFTLMSEIWPQNILENKTAMFGIFKCSCGIEKVLQCSRVKNGHIKSCGCSRKEVNKKEYKVHENKFYQYWSRFKSDFCEEWQDLDVFSRWLESIGFKAGMSFKKRDPNNKYSPNNYIIGYRKDFGKNSDICGKKFNKLTVISSPYKKNKSYYVDCVCDCGNKISLQPSAIKSGRTKSCGCINKAKRKLDALYNTNRLSDNIAYKRWHSIFKSAKKFNTQVCEEWQDFNRFNEWFNKNYIHGLHLFNFDKTKEYGPDSCKFVKKYEICLDNAKKYPRIGRAISNEEIEKRRNTNLRKYGVENYLQSKEGRLKTKETCLRKYGVENPFSVKEFQIKSIETKIEKYGESFWLKTSGAEEKSLGDFLNSFGFVFKSDWKILGGKQLDFYCEELKLAIEYNGIYWHHEKSPSPRDRNYHIGKYRKCKEAGIRLISIWSDEWIDKQENVKNHLAAIISSGQTKIFGRSCESKIIDKKTAKDFIDQNHIQGSSNILLAAGLFYKGDLVGTISFARHHRGKGIVLNRMCFKSGITIIGGASKLLSKCIPEIKSLGYDSIITWSDNRYSEGNVYEKIGFKFDGDLKQDYQYVLTKNPKGRFSKQSMKKSNTNCPIDMTEKDWMELNGFARIWDCGKKRWKLEI